jgi:hypothetical protein
MYVNGKMIPVESVPGLTVVGETKENDTGEAFQDGD